MDTTLCKQLAAEEATSFVENGAIVGLGTGSTAAYFIKALALRCKKGLKIEVIASSEASRHLAEQERLPVQNIESLQIIDLYVDGADEIDPSKQMIKGAGGALLREKILAHMSKSVMIIVDETKLVSKLGARPLPVEIIPFGAQATIRHLNELGYQGALRKNEKGALLLTENHNYLYDIQFPTPQDNLSIDHARISSIPGVVETGFFHGRVDRVVIGFQDGVVKTQ